jgi:hypothetical protein
MKLIIQRINTANKPSPLSEGVMNIRINSQPCKGMNPITWHTQARRAPWVATVHEVIKKLGWVLPHPSVVSHMYASANTPWEAWTLSHCTPMKRGKVSSNSLIDDATQFGDSICPVCISTFKFLFNRAQLTWALFDTGGATTMELRISYQTTPLPSHLVFSTFP